MPVALDYQPGRGTASIHPYFGEILGSDHEYWWTLSLRLRDVWGPSRSREDDHLRSFSWQLLRVFIGKLRNAAEKIEEKQKAFLKSGPEYTPTTPRGQGGGRSQTPYSWTLSCPWGPMD